METTKEMFRFYVYTEKQRGCTPKAIYKNMSTVWGDKIPGYSTIYAWCTKFGQGSTSLQDLPKSGRPTTSNSASNIELVRQLIIDDNHLHVRDVAEQLGISIGSAHSILRKDLQLRNVYSSWFLINLLAL